jgi:hypothetical protein
MTAAPTQSKASVAVKTFRVLRRIAMILIAGFAIGWTLNRAALALERRNEAAGFVHGIVQGALMPMALPNLAVGRDVTIYSANNTGRTYKLGYTVGVNTCGLIFFGFFFWRVRKWKRAVAR